MKYISTRGKAPKLGFEDVVIAGLASDGGLYVPESIPTFSKKEIASFAGLSYEELFFKISKIFVGGEISDGKLKSLIKESYADFRHKAIAPLTQIGNQEFILELYHGPTLAFKDFALQFLGRVFDYILTKREKNVTIVGATSGDTGSAAIEGCRHSGHVNIFILHPHKRVSEIQRRQMTSVIADNVHNIAIEGNFDDCQQMVKELFANQSFLEGNGQLVAVNSINWCRIMAQIVYYFYAALQLGAPHREVSFSVPTGNFGDIFAGYIAHRMGLPVKQLIVATNKNDILHRFFSNNDYSRGELVKTLSPSMDIQVSSNFERLLYYVHNQNSKEVADLMEKSKSGRMPVNDDILKKIREIFTSFATDDEVTCQVISDVYKSTGLVVDPHTATGINAARQVGNLKDVPMVILSTAHPVKFPEAVERAGVVLPDLPPHMADLMSRPEKFEVLPNDIERLKKFIAKAS